MKREFDLRPLDDLPVDLIATVAVRYETNTTLFIINERIHAKFKEYFRHYSGLLEPNLSLKLQNSLFGVPFVVR